MATYTVKHRRGALATMPVLAEGELALATDERALFVGTSEGNRRVGGEAELIDIRDYLSLVSDGIWTDAIRAAVAEGHSRTSNARRGLHLPGRAADYYIHEQIRLPRYFRVVSALGRGHGTIRPVAAFPWSSSWKNAAVVLGDYNRDANGDLWAGSILGSAIRTTAPGSAVVEITVVGHSLLTDDTWTPASGVSGPIDGIPAGDFNGVEFQVTKTGTDTFTVVTDTVATAGNVTGSAGDTVPWTAAEGAIAFATGLSGIMVLADEDNTDATSVGIFSRRMQEQGGLRECAVSRFGKHALWLEHANDGNPNITTNTVQNYLLHHCTFSLSQKATVGNASDPPASVFIKGAQDHFGMHDCTLGSAFGAIGGDGTPASDLNGGDGVTASLRLSGVTMGSWGGNNFEDHRYGVLVESDCKRLKIENLAGHAAMRDLVHIEAGATDVEVSSLNRKDATNAVWDGNRASGDEALTDPPHHYVSGVTSTSKTRVGSVEMTGSEVAEFAEVTLAAAATTLSVAGRKHIRLTGDSGGNTLTNFTGGRDGQEVFIHCLDDNVTFDFSGTDLRSKGGRDRNVRQHGMLSAKGTMIGGSLRWACWSPMWVESEDEVLTASDDAALLVAKSSTTLTAALSGASVTLSGAFPAGCIPLGLSARVTIDITGATSWDAGDGSDVDRWAASKALTAGTIVDLRDVTAPSLVIAPSALDVVFTANGSNFTGGKIRATAHYFTLQAALS